MAMLITSKVFERTWGGDPMPEFWPSAIAACQDVNKDFVFIAEVYWDMEFDLQELGFTFTYDKRLLDRLLENNGAEVASHLMADLQF